MGHKTIPGSRAARTWERCRSHPTPWSATECHTDNPFFHLFKEKNRLTINHLHNYFDNSKRQKIYFCWHFQKKKKFDQTSVHKSTLTKISWPDVALNILHAVTKQKNKNYKKEQ
jgi:hypothetical protein